jgi:hypothetical protein
MMMQSRHSRQLEPMRRVQKRARARFDIRIKGVLMANSSFIFMRASIWNSRSGRCAVFPGGGQIRNGRIAGVERRRGRGSAEDSRRLAQIPLL